MNELTIEKLIRIREDIKNASNASISEMIRLQLLLARDSMSRAIYLMEAADKPKPKL